MHGATLDNASKTADEVPHANRDEVIVAESRVRLNR